MSNCKERNFELIIRITAYAASDVTIRKYLGDGRKYINQSDFTLSESGGVEVAMDPKSATMSENDSISLPGVCFDCTVEYTLSNPGSKEYNAVDYLMDVPCHLVVETFGGNRFLIPANEDTYDLQQRWNGKQLSVTLSVTNESGILQII